MPPPEAVKAGKVAPLTDEDRRTLVRWIGLGCPIDTAFDPENPDRPGDGWMLDDQRPTLTITYPQSGTSSDLSRILIGMHDYYSGLVPDSFRVVADFPIDDIPAGENLASKFQTVSQGVWEYRLSKPIQQLTRGTLTVSVQDQQGNQSRIERTLAVEPAWIERMRHVHGQFTGTPGTLALFGDSITISLAFWAPLRGEPHNMPEKMAEAHKLVQGYMKAECWDQWRGPEYGNNGRMTIRWADENVDAWLKAHNPEVAVIMFGSNDLFQLQIDEFEQKTAHVVQRCLDNGTIVLLTTLPPCSGRLEQAKQFADAVRRVAQEKKVPLIDYQAEILNRRPDDWDGTLPKFKGVEDVYQVPTLISGDGVHPSNPQTHRDFSQDSLNSNGYLLRSYLTLLGYAEVIERVCQAKE
jgi:lysophospholipase L1-like esterase